MLPGSRYIPKCPEWGFSILLCCGTTPRESSWTCPIHSGRQQDLSGLLEPSFGSTQRIQHLLPGNEQCREGEPPPKFAFSLPWGRAAVEFYKYSVACVRKKIKKKWGETVCRGGVVSVPNRVHSSGPTVGLRLHASSIALDSCFLVTASPWAFFRKAHKNNCEENDLRSWVCCRWDWRPSKYRHCCLLCSVVAHFRRLNLLQDK